MTTATKGKILIIEDETDLIRLIRHNLKREQYVVTTARDAETGLKLARSIKPDLILLDIMMPGMDGLELLKVLRSEIDVPILLLTAKRSEMDRILGLKLGADDYIVKPFSMGELQVRIEGHIRRAAEHTARDTNKKISVGKIDIDFERHEIKIKGQPTYLAPKEFAILKLLVEANGKVLTRETMLQTLWNHDKDIDIGTRTVDQHIARLRQKLRSEATHIKTVPNLGYQVTTPR